MCTYNNSESPRSIEFLFSKSRLNVVISKVKALTILVGSQNLATKAVDN